MLDEHLEIQAALAQPMEEEDDLEDELAQLLTPQDTLEKQPKELPIPTGELLLPTRPKFEYGCEVQELQDELKCCLTVDCCIDLLELPDIVPASPSRLKMPTMEPAL